MCIFSSSTAKYKDEDLHRQKKNQRFHGRGRYKIGDIGELQHYITKGEFYDQMVADELKHEIQRIKSQKNDRIVNTTSPYAVILTLTRELAREHAQNIIPILQGQHCNSFKQVYCYVFTYN